MTFCLNNICAKQEVEGNGAKQEVEGNGAKQEVEGNGAKQEVEGNGAKQEVEGNGTTKATAANHLYPKLHKIPFYCKKFFSTISVGHTLQILASPRHCQFCLSFVIL